MMGANVPCSIQAELWNEAGYSQEAIVLEDPLTVSPLSPVTVRMPPGRWYIKVNNSCPIPNLQSQLSG
jgi:hypothetical protein